jgi:hypothetical protein
MYTLGAVEPQLLVVAVLTRHVGVFEWATQRLASAFGPVALASPPVAFPETAYYKATMGPDLLQMLVAHEELQPPDSLASVKKASIAMEHELAATKAFPDSRPVNLDPGFLGLGKFVLATTKDQAHRIYLHDGIFAEVTLRFADGRFQAQPWTYANYTTPEVMAFLMAARAYFCSRRANRTPKET